MNLLKEIPISHLEFNKMSVSFYANGILYVRVKPELELEIADIGPVEDYVKALGRDKFLNLFEFDKYASANDEVRKWAANPEGNTRTIADAIVISGLDQKLIGDFYIGFHKPVKPTKLFSTREEAADWLLSIKPE